MCRVSCSQTRWATSPASASPSRCPRQMDQISEAYRSTSASHACWSPFLARVTKSVTEAPAGYGGAAVLAVSVIMIKGQDAGAVGEADLVHWFLLKGGPGPVLPLVRAAAGTGCSFGRFHSTTAAGRAHRGQPLSASGLPPYERITARAGPPNPGPGPAQPADCCHAAGRPAGPR